MSFYYVFERSALSCYQMICSCKAFTLFSKNSAFYASSSAPGSFITLNFTCFLFWAHLDCRNLLLYKVVSNLLLFLLADSSSYFTFQIYEMNIFLSRRIQIKNQSLILSQQHNLQKVKPMKSTTEEFTKVAFSCLQLFSSNPDNKLSNKQKKAKLNLFGKGITHIKTLTPQQIITLESIKQLDLSHNAIVSIENLKELRLSQINLSHNKILEQEKLYDVLVKDKNCKLSKNITKITLKGNPFLKKPLSPEFKRWLFLVENDLELFNKEQYEYLDLLVQRFIEKVMLQNLLNKVSVNLQFLREYRPKLDEDYERLLLLRPEDYFKTLKRQMQWKIQAEPLSTVKKEVTMNLPLQFFSSARQKSHMKQYASQLILQLRKRNQNLIKNNKEIVQKIQHTISNYLTQKKILIEKQQKGSPRKYQAITTPYKNLFVLKKSSQIKQSNRQEEEIFPEISTPIYTKRYSSSKPKVLSIYQSEPKSNQLLIQRAKIIEVKQERNPFEQISRQMEEKVLKQDLVMRQISKNKENLVLSPKKHDQKFKKVIEIKNSSKTHFELSQSLLQRPVVNSDESLHFQLEDGIAQSQIQKMFFQILTKLNPIYHLLYSPIQSLKPTQKNSLITNLLDLLKEKLKYIEKLERFKLLYETEKQKHEELFVLYKKEKQNLEAIWGRRQDLSLQLKQVEKEVKMLSEEIQTKTQQNFALTEENQKLKDQLIYYHQIKLHRDEEERIEDIIRSNRQTKLKIDYLDFLRKKAQKIYRFKRNMEDLNFKQNRNLVYSCFIQMSKEAKITKSFNFLRSKVIQQNLGFFKLTIQSTFKRAKETDKKLQFLKKLIVVQHAKDMLKKIAAMRSSNQKHKIAQKHCQRKMKKRFLKTLDLNVEFEKGIEYELMVNQFRKQSKQRLKRWVFDEWLIWKKGLLHKEVEVRVNHEGVLACNIVERLCDFTTSQRSYHAKTVALQMYLRDMRTFNSFHKLYHFMCTQTKKWKMKLFKINLFTKRIFLDDFISGVRFKKNQRKIKEKDQKIINRKLEFNELSEFKLKKKVIKNKIKNKLRQCYFMKVVDLMMITKKQIEVERKLNKNRVGQVYNQMRSIHKARSAFKTKKREVVLLSRAYHSSLKNRFSVEDVFCYFRRKLRFKRMFIQFFINKNKRLLQKTFYQFRINCLEQKASFFEDKLKQLGPDIDLIEQRQIQTNIEKVSLCRQIQLKNQQMEEYQKEIQELRLLLEAKEIKYEKLKEIYAETIEINAREREYFEGQSAFIRQSLPYDFKSNLSSKKDESSQKSLKFDSKPEVNRYRLHSGYSPERDTMMSKEKRKVNQYKMEGKQNIFQQTNRIQKPGVNSQSISKKDKISEIYPSFRRF